MGIGKPRVCLGPIGLLEYFGTFFICSEEDIIWSTVLDLGKMFSSRTDGEFDSIVGFVFKYVNQLICS